MIFEAFWKMRLLLLSIPFFTFCSVCGKKTATTPLEKVINNPYMHRNVSDLIKYYGYPLEEYSIVTPDGYILLLQRMPHGRKNNTKEKRKGVVLLVHGIFADSLAWVFKSQSLGFMLADEGYDVWLINLRGCKYSKKHIKYKTNQYKFWDFSFDELAEYDVPITIDYILKATSEKALYLIAHSQGTTATFAMLSEKPEYNKKIKLFIAIGPVTSVGYVTTLAKTFAPYSKEISLTITLFTSGELSLDNKFAWILQDMLCPAVGQEEDCKKKFYETVGVDQSRMNETAVSTAGKQLSSSSSVKCLVHYAQLLESKKFRKFDYGYLNKEYYKQEEPPDYDLSRITTPVALISSLNDTIANPQDVDVLRRKLKSLVFDYCVPQEYNHADFFLSEDVPQLVDKPILKLLVKY